MNLLPSRRYILVTSLSEKEALYHLFLFAHADKNQLYSHFATGWKFYGYVQNNAFRFTYFKPRSNGKDAYNVEGNIGRKEETILTLKVSMASVKLFYFRSFVFLAMASALILPNLLKGDFGKVLFFLPFLGVPLLDYLGSFVRLRKRSRIIAHEIAEQVQGRVAG